MKIKDIIHQLETFFPLSYQEEWDHSGLQVGNVDDECAKVLVCLNVNTSTIQQAIQLGANLIVSHHPFLFHPVSTIDTSTIHGLNIQQLLQHNIAVYSMHTNYDALRMNEMILENLQCSHIHSIEESGIVRMGTLKHPLYFHNLIEYLKEQFNLSSIRYCGHVPDDLIETIALCAGSGHEYIDSALTHTNIYITGDLTYSHAMDIILRRDGCVIELPHFIEEAFKNDVAKYISCDCQLAKEQDYFKII